MFFINKNTVINQLEEVVHTNFQRKVSHLPDSFQKEQLRAIEIFKKRFFLEEVIEESISFNQKLGWDYPNKNLQLATSAEELLEVFKLRSDVFNSINYQYEFPDTIEGLNFDKFDKHSAIIYYKTNNTFTGTIRLIYDAPYGLPSEKAYSFEEVRTKHNIIGEISRNVIRNEGRGLNLEFKYLMCGIYNIFINNDIDIAISGIKQEHLKLFKKLGGVEVVQELNGYGSLKAPVCIISYDPTGASKFFKKVFLEEK